MLALLAALVTSGCGGSSDTKANEAYADSVCTAIGTWQHQIKSVAADFSSGVSQAAFQTSVAQAQAATKTLVTQIKAVPPPDTSQGQAAKQQLDQLTTDISDTTDATKTALTQIQATASASTVGVTIAALAPQIKNLANETTSAISSLKDAGGSLASAFQNTDSCTALGRG
jgi:hypothetical protein